MARPINRLTTRTVSAAKAPGWYADGQGLYLRIDSGGAKRWVYVFQWRSARKEMGLGSALDVSLAQAREARVLARAEVKAERNPIEERRRARRSTASTFGEIADQVVATVAAGAKTPGKLEAAWARTFSLYVPQLRPLAVDEVTTEDVIAALNPIWLKIPESARRARARIERVLDAAKAANLIRPPWENPARWKGHLELLMAKSPKLTHGHRPAMPWADMPDFWKRLLEADGLGAAALRFTILNVARENETLGALWHEIDDKAVWTVPGGREGRMKGERPPDHRVPLSNAALAELEAVRPINGKRVGLVFPGQRKGRPMSSETMDAVLDRMGEGRYTVHGFRSTFRDWVGENTNFPRELAEAALAHQVKDDAERAYSRGDALAKRRKMMEAWANYLARGAAR